MSVKTKKVIFTLAGITCEYCVYLQDHRGEDVCINPDSYDWVRDRDEVCSKGKWLIKADSPNLPRDYDYCYSLFNG